MAKPCRVLYCHCAYAKVVPAEVKAEVLRRLTASGQPFDAVADLCEMSAKGDPALRRIAEQENVRIAACYPRAVKWLFSAAGAPLSEQRRHVFNMRTEPPEEIVAGLFAECPPEAEPADEQEAPGGVADPSLGDLDERSVDPLRRQGT